MLRRLLLLTASIYDWGDARCGVDQLERLRHDIGLTFLSSTDPAKSMLARVMECITRAQERYDATPEPERGFSPVEAVREMCACVMSLQSALGNAHEMKLTAEACQNLEPLRGLSPQIDLIAQLVWLSHERLLGRELGDRGFSLGVVKYMGATELPDVIRL